MSSYDTDYCPICNSKKNKKIKVESVCFEKTIQSISDLIIAAPIGIDIDPLTGKLNSKAHIEIISKPNLTAKLENDVLIIEGLLHVKIIFENPKPCPCTDVWKMTCQEVFLPIQSVVLMEKCKACNHRTCNLLCDDDISIKANAKVISTSIFGVPDKNTTLAGNPFNLIVKAVLEISINILKDEIINLSSYYSHFN